MEPKGRTGARSLTVCGVSVVGALFGVGDRHAWLALIASGILLVTVVVLAMSFNVRIEIDDRLEDGHRHRELRGTRRPRRRQASRRPAGLVTPPLRQRRCWLTSRARR
jgi:hypothetical protein